MQIIEYFEDGQKEHWVKEIEGFSWGAAKYLAKLLRENSFEDTLGKNGKALSPDRRRKNSFLCHPYPSGLYRR